ncbi:MAG: hypothetical protein NC314_12995 [Roseburia sp.]|nr:hypothetical protein [Roseburia sp.]MCM1243754.1 hypothetical protein [Roseburia sp.]
MKKKLMISSIFLILTLTLSAALSGCGHTDRADGADTADGTNPADPADSSDTAAFDITAPPVIELCNTTDNKNSITVRPCGYTWTYLEPGDLATSGIADSADPLTENAPWGILTVPDNGTDAGDYTISVAAEPDKLVITAWDSSFIGKSSADTPTAEGCIYDREELTAADFTIPIRPGRVYEVSLTWDKEKAEENGFYGIGYYIFMTDGEMAAGQESGLNEEEKTLEEITGDVYTEQVDELPGVMMLVSSVSAKGATVTCMNSTDKQITFGDDYELQVWQDRDGQKQSGWHQVKYILDDYAFNAIGYELSQDMSLDWKVDWTYFHGILPAGKYRITKSVLDFRGTGDFTKYNLAAEFTILTDEENEELNEANEETFQKAVETFGLKEAEAADYFRMLCDDGVIQNGVMELSGLAMSDFDQNGQEDVAVMVQASELKYLYGTGCLYFYMNGEEPCRFYDEDFPFYFLMGISAADLDHDGNTEIVFGACGTGNGGTGDWHNRILKYKGHTMERMLIPSELQDEDGFIDVDVTKEEQENTYRASCVYLNDEIVFKAHNLEGDYGGGGSNCRGFYDVHCVEYGDGYALQASEYLYGEGGIAHGVADVKFLIVWDESGNSHVEKWWIEPYE